LLWAGLPPGKGGLAAHLLKYERIVVMTTMRSIIAGPAKWDLMQSMFEGSTVMFTLDDNQRIEGEVQTLHKHKGEPRLSEVPGLYHPNAPQLDWLIQVDFNQTKHPDICMAYIEYDMTTRTGLCTLYSDVEFEISDMLYLPEEWSRMMGIETRQPQL